MGTGSQGYEHGESERSDRPPAAAEQIERFQEQDTAFRRDPENWDKADGLKRLASEDRDDLIPGPNEYEENYKDPTTLTVRTEGALRLELGTPSEAERLGDRIASAENDRRSLRGKVMDEAATRLDDVDEAVRKETQTLLDALTDPGPTGAYTECRPDPVVVDRPPHATQQVALGDVLGAAIATSVAISRGFDLVRNFGKERKATEDASDG